MSKMKNPSEDAPELESERDAETPGKSLPPLPLKLPENPDYLRKREEWFRKQSGQTKK